MLACSGTVHMPNRIARVPAAPKPIVPIAAAQCVLTSTADDSRTAIHIAVSARRFADGGMPPASASRLRGGPNHGFSPSHRSKRGELREKQYDAARTKTVVGNPGTITPTAASATAHQPKLE
jgi:hypothetical protein